MVVLFAYSRYETTKGSHASDKLLNILHLFGWLHVQDSFDFLRVRAYAVMTDDIAK